MCGVDMYVQYQAVIHRDSELAPILLHIGYTNSNQLTPHRQKKTTPTAVVLLSLWCLTPFQCGKRRCAQLYARCSERVATLIHTDTVKRHTSPSPCQPLLTISGLHVHMGDITPPYTLIISIFMHTIYPNRHVRITSGTKTSITGSFE